eukprot:PhF_6_TR37879/c0_g1_i1/m.56511
MIPLPWNPWTSSPSLSQSTKKAINDTNPCAADIPEEFYGRTMRWSDVVEYIHSTQMALSCVDALRDPRYDAAVVACETSSCGEGAIALCLLLNPFLTPLEIHETFVMDYRESLSDLGDFQQSVVSSDYFRKRIIQLCEERYGASVVPLPISAFEIEKVMCLERRKAKSISQQNELVNLASELHIALSLWDQHIAALSHPLHTLQCFINSVHPNKPTNDEEQEYLLRSYTEYVLMFILDDKLESEGLKPKGEAESDKKFIMRCVSVMKSAYGDASDIDFVTQDWMQRNWEESDELWCRRLLCFVSDSIRFEGAKWTQRPPIARFGATEDDDTIVERLQSTLQHLIEASDDACIFLSKCFRTFPRREDESDEGWFSRLCEEFPSIRKEAEKCVEEYSDREKHSSHNDHVNYAQLSAKEKEVLLNAAGPLSTLRCAVSKMQSDEEYISYARDVVNAAFVSNAVAECFNVYRCDGEEIAGLLRAWAGSELVPIPESELTRKSDEKDEDWSLRLRYEVLTSALNSATKDFKEWAQRYRGSVRLTPESDRTPTCIQEALIADIHNVENLISTCQQTNHTTKLKGTLHNAFFREYPEAENDEPLASLLKYKEWYVNYFVEQTRKGKSVTSMRIRTQSTRRGSGVVDAYADLLTKASMRISKGEPSADLFLKNTSITPQAVDANPPSPSPQPVELPSAVKPLPEIHIPDTHIILTSTVYVDSPKKDNLENSFEQQQNKMELDYGGVPYLESVEESSLGAPPQTDGNIISAPGHEWVVFPTLGGPHVLFRTSQDLREALQRQAVRLTDMCCPIPDHGLVERSRKHKLVMEFDEFFNHHSYHPPHSSLNPASSQQNNSTNDGLSFATQMQRLMDSINGSAQATQKIILEAQAKGIAVMSPVLTSPKLKTSKGTSVGDDVSNLIKPTKVESSSNTWIAEETASIVLKVTYPADGEDTRTLSRPLPIVHQSLDKFFNRGSLRTPGIPVAIDTVELNVLRR